jgi:hypothetical protein
MRLMQDSPSSVQKRAMGRSARPPSRLDLSPELLHRATKSCHPISARVGRSKIGHKVLQWRRPRGMAACGVILRHHLSAPHFVPHGRQGRGAEADAGGQDQPHPPKTGEPPTRSGSTCVIGNLIRYQVAIDRSGERALHELQRLQARRRGEAVAAPIRDGRQPLDRCAGPTRAGRFTRGAPVTREHSNRSASVAVAPGSKISEASRRSGSRELSAPWAHRRAAAVMRARVERHARSSPSSQPDPRRITVSELDTGTFEGLLDRHQRLN